MTTATQSYTQTGVGVSSAMMESEMNKIAADVENMEKESSVIEAQVANELTESTQS